MRKSAGDFQQGLRRGLRRAGAILLDGLMPPRCPSCALPVHRQQRLCAACFAGLSFITAPYCRACGLPFTLARDGGPAQICPSCIARPLGFRHGRAAFLYDDAAQRLILPFKHGDRTELADLLGLLMARAGGPILAEAEILVPVPLHHRRLAMRRYNQAALLALDLAKRAGKPCAVDALTRPRATAPLGMLSAAARTQEVSGAFALSAGAKRRLEGRTVLLVDDVMTSGATLSACARALLAGGATEVDVLVAARVPDPRQSDPVQGGHALAPAGADGKSSLR